MTFFFCLVGPLKKKKKKNTHTHDLYSNTCRLVKKHVACFVASESLTKEDA